MEFFVFMLSIYIVPRFFSLLWLVSVTAEVVCSSSVSVLYEIKLLEPVLQSTAISFHYLCK